MRGALAAIVLLLGLPGDVSAAAESSPGVRLETTIAEKGVVSARALDGHLHVSSLSGVTIFDISIPRAPCAWDGWTCPTSRTRTSTWARAPSSSPTTRPAGAGSST